MSIIRFRTEKGWYGETNRHSDVAKAWHFKKKLIRLAKKQVVSYATGYVVNPALTNVLVKRGIPESKAKRIIFIASNFY